MSEDKSKKILEGKLDKSQGEFVGRSGLTYQSKESVASKSQVSQFLSFPISPAHRCVNATHLHNSQIIGEAVYNSPALRCDNVTHLPNSQITGEAIYNSPALRCGNVTHLPNNQITGEAIYNSPAHRCDNVTHHPNSQITGEAIYNSPALRCGNVTHFPNSPTTDEAIYNSPVHRCGNVTHLPNIQITGEALCKPPHQPSTQVGRSQCYICSDLCFTYVDDIENEKKCLLTAKISIFKMLIHINICDFPFHMAIWVLCFYWMFHISL